MSNVAISQPRSDVNALQSKIERLEQDLAFERADNERLRAALRLSDDILAVKTDTLKPGHKVTRLALEKELIRHTPDAGGWMKIDTWAIEKDSDTDIATVRKHLTYFDKLGIIKKRTVRIDMGLNPETGKKEYTSEYYVKKQAYFQQPLSYRVKPEDVRKQGGAREGAGRGHKRHCQHCGSEQGDAYNIFYCHRCKQWSHEVVEENREIQVELADPDGTRALVVQEEEAAIETIKLSPSPTPPREIQLEFADSEDEPITAPLAPLDWSATLTAWLEKRIGERIICATGKLVQNQKYYTQPEGYLPDMAAYLRGDPEHVYGSRLLLSTGLSWLIEYDFDDTQPEHDQHHKQYMRRLADAGIASFYAARRPGRGHLGLPFSGPIDPQAAYAWANSIVPEMVTVNECYPVNGVEDKRNEPLSWPFYQRIGSQVTECKIEVMYPAAPGHLYSSKGIVSEPEKLAELIRRCVTDASLVPARKVEEVQPYAGRLLEKPLPRSAWEDDLIEAFNRSHSWSFIADLCGGWSRTGHFRAIWRCERTASVKPDGDDSRYCCDYGNHGNFPKKLDKYGAYCLIMNIDQVADLKAQRVRMREAVPA